MYTYRCGDLEWSDGTTIGYNGGPVGDFYANHPFSGVNAKHIDCLNFGVLEWSNVVYNVSCDVCIPTEPPPLPPPCKTSVPWAELGSYNDFLCTVPDVYLEFLERTSSSITMRRCDDCASGVIDSTIPVPFGEHLLFDAYVSFTLRLEKLIVVIQ